MTATVETLIVTAVGEGLVIRDLGTRYGWRWEDAPADRDLAERLDRLDADGRLVVDARDAVVSAVSLSTAGWALLP